MILIYALAKKRGIYKGRKPSLNTEQVQELKRLVGTGVPKAELARQFKICRETLYSYLRTGPVGRPKPQVG